MPKKSKKPMTEVDGVLVPDDPHSIAWAKRAQRRRDNNKILNYLHDQIEQVQAAILEDEVAEFLDSIRELPVEKQLESVEFYFRKNYKILDTNCMGDWCAKNSKLLASLHAVKS